MDCLRIQRGDPAAPARRSRCQPVSGLWQGTLAWSPSSRLTASSHVFHHLDELSTAAYLASTHPRSYPQNLLTSFAPEQNPPFTRLLQIFHRQTPAFSIPQILQCPIWGVSAVAPQYLVVLYLTRTRAGGTFNLTPGFGEAPETLAHTLTRNFNPASSPALA